MNKKIQFLKSRIADIKLSGLSRSEKIIQQRILAESIRIKNLRLSYYLDASELWMIRILNVIMVIILVYNLINPIFIGPIPPLLIMAILFITSARARFVNNHMIRNAKKEYHKTKRALRAIKHSEVGGLSMDSYRWYNMRKLMIEEVEDLQNED